MISNQILQNTIDGLKNIGRVELAVMDIDGKEIASTDDMRDCAARCAEFAKSPTESQEVSGHQYFKIYDEYQLEYILVVQGTGDTAYMIGKMSAFQIQSLLVAYKERFDKDNFVKNLLLDNLLLVDIYSHSKKLHMQFEQRRTVLLIQADNSRETNMLELTKTGFGNSPREFITAVDEKDVIILKDLAENETNADIDKYAASVVRYLAKEGVRNVRVAYGSSVGEIKDVSRSYKEAKMALDVGRIFFEEKDVIAYSQLGIGRLIYQLPIPLCKMFIREIFGGRSFDDFDEETLTTINKFFENNLNVSETSRQLFIHRNTLVHRLDKLQKTTGLDLRVFEDAITFHIALMVVKYMKYMEKMD
ncbi:MAG: helix-turn-helix domain-containing protein [Lachnospiraceae bacterium]|nr:helix-turn-helix domain-containing protein [Lachnospiraceae bacterium]